MISIFYYSIVILSSFLKEDFRFLEFPEFSKRKTFLCSNVPVLEEIGSGIVLFLTPKIMA